MIQRQQSLWLLLSAITSFFSYQFPFYTGNRTENNMTVYSELDGGSNFFLLILTGALLLTAAITIFLFKDRKTQFRLCLGAIVISIGVIILYIVEVRKFLNGNFALTALLIFATLIGFIMAARGIRKDDKLVKSLDKLR